jgi:hypothetical protein
MISNTLIRMDVRTISPHALFLEFAGLVLIKAIFSITAMREKGTLNNNKEN